MEKSFKNLQLKMKLNFVQYLTSVKCHRSKKLSDQPYRHHESASKCPFQHSIIDTGANIMQAFTTRLMQLCFQGVWKAYLDASHFSLLVKYDCN